MNKKHENVKRVLMLMIVFCVIGKVHGQVEKKHYWGTQLLLGSLDYNINSSNSGLSSSKNYDGMIIYKGIGIDYWYLLSENFELCLGMSGAFNEIVITTSYYWTQQTPWGSGSGGSGGTYKPSDKLPMLSLPVHLKINFRKYFFIGGGPCLNIQNSRDYKWWGMGLALNAGFEYIFKSGVSVSVTPRRQWNVLNLFSNIDANMDIMTQTGINIGLGYRFGKQTKTKMHYPPGANPERYF